jgi:uncharacterized membrane protein
MARKDDLSKPRGSGGGSGYDSDAFARWAESVARFLGTGRYLAVQTIIVIVWVAINAFAWELRWDHYPFILLNLLFSTQAAYAAPLILLAQNRQTDRDKEEVERDRDTNARSLAETEFLAREIAELRIALEQKADRDDLVEPLARLTQAIEDLHHVNIATAADDGEESLSKPSERDDHDHDRHDH